MNNQIFEIPFLRAVSLAITYKCQIQCSHCIMNAGPNRKEIVDMNQAKEWIQQISDYAGGHIKVLSITGGEPFYDIDLLKNIVQFASGCGLTINVVTNAYWAKTKDDAISVLKNLNDVRVLAISTDKYHQKYISIQHIRNAIEAAQKCGMLYNVHITIHNAAEYQKIYSALKDLVSSDKIISVSTVPYGRAKNEISTSGVQLRKDPPLSACTAGSTPVILPNGDVLACMGPLMDLKRKNPLILGNINENPLHHILDESEKNILLHILRVWGPNKIISILKENGMEELLPIEYVQGSVCDTCFKIMSNEKIVSFYQNEYVNEDFLHYIAYARLFYLKETRMAAFCKIAPQ